MPAPGSVLWNLMTPGRPQLASLPWYSVPTLLVERPGLPPMTMIPIVLLDPLLGMLIVVILSMFGRAVTMLLILPGHMPKFEIRTTLPPWLMTQKHLVLLTPFTLLACS